MLKDVSSELFSYLRVKRIKVKLEITRKMLLEHSSICDRVMTALIVGHLLKLVERGLGVVSQLLHSEGGLGVNNSVVTVSSVGEYEDGYPDTRVTLFHSSPGLMEAEIACKVFICILHTCLPLVCFGPSMVIMLRLVLSLRSLHNTLPSFQVRFSCNLQPHIMADSLIFVTDTTFTPTLT